MINVRPYYWRLAPLSLDPNDNDLAQYLTSLEKEERIVSVVLQSDDQCKASDGTITRILGFLVISRTKD